MVIHPGYAGRVHTHPTEQVIMIMEGSIQMILGEDVRTIRNGFTLLAPAGIPHTLINNTWVTARIFVIDSCNDVQTGYVD